MNEAIEPLKALDPISHTVTVILNPEMARAMCRPLPRIRRPVGRPPKPEPIWAEIRRQAQQDNLSNRQIAALTGVAFSTVAKYRREHGLARDARN